MKSQKKSTTEITRELRRCQRYWCKNRPRVVLLADSQRHQAIVRDVCRDGLGLLLPRFFKPGSAVEIQFWGGEHCWVISAETKHSTLQVDGSWLLGCSVSKAFTDEELATLQLHFPAPNPDAGPNVQPANPDANEPTWPLD